ncbi:MAG TPA: hypothetical protein VGX48_17095 [Pyrinomonadaceae bacterium]|nr:hypothetical protein [Pyrinomonadaceae bacterium]
MNPRTALIAAALACALAAAAGCGGSKPANTAPANAAGQAAATPTPVKAGPLPDNGFKAELTLPDPPTRLRAGQKETVQVHVRNASDVMWWAQGGEINEGQGNKYYLAAGNRWLKPDGKLVTDMDGRHGIIKNLKPGEESDVPLVITAPKEPGDYLLEVDLVQEQVGWFSDKGSPTARTKVTVVK